MRVATYTQCATRRVPLSLTGASTLPQAQKGTARGARRFLTLPSFGRRPLGSRDPSPIVLPSALGAGAGRNACLRGAAVGWQSPMNMRDAENSRLASPRTPAHRALCALLPLSERARGYREQNPTFLRPIHVGTPPVERKLVSLRAPAIDARGIPDARGAGGADRIVRKAPKQRSVGGPRRRRAQTETAAQTFHSRGLPFVFVGHRVVGAGASHTGVTLARPHVEARAVRGLWRRGWMGGGASWALWARRGAPRVCRLGTVTRLGASRPLLRAPDSPPVLLRARHRGFTAPTMRVSAGPGGPSSHRTARLCLQNSLGVSGGGWSAGRRKSGPRRQPFAESSGARPRWAPHTCMRTARAGDRADRASTRRAERR